MRRMRCTCASSMCCEIQRCTNSGLLSFQLFTWTAGSKVVFQSFQLNDLCLHWQCGELADSGQPGGLPRVQLGHFSPKDELP